MSLVLLSLVAASAGCSLLTNLDDLAGPDADGGGSGTEGGARDDATAPGADGAAGDGAGGDGAADGDAAAKYTFTDDFNRADTVSGLGNGWNEKFVGFRLAGGQAERFQMGTYDYRDTIASRPSAETVGDVDVSVEFRFAPANAGYVQVHARVQTATLAQGGALDSYILFRNLNVDDGKTFTIARQRGTATFVSLKDFQSSSVVGSAAKYRLRLRVTGSSPVTLAGSVEIQNSTTWDMLGAATVQDTAAQRIDGPGVVGISAGNDPTEAYVYDNFVATGL